MYGSFYSNQEAMERCSLQLGMLGLVAGYTFLSLCLIYVGIHSDDEDRYYEEINLDTGELTLFYTLNLQREELAVHLRDKGILYGEGSSGEPILHEYLADDIAYERELLEEIYEFPVSAIVSNNYYMVPVDQRNYVNFYHLFRKYNQTTLFSTQPALAIASRVRKNPPKKVKKIKKKGYSYLHGGSKMEQITSSDSSNVFFGYNNSLAKTYKAIANHKPLLQDLGYY